MTSGKIDLMASWVPREAQLNWEAKRRSALHNDKKIPPMPRPRATWRIVTLPHIAMLLKRLFPSLKAQMGTLYLTQSPENDRNLAWFMLRYPMEVRPAAALFDSAKAHKEGVARLRDLLGSDGSPRTVADCLRDDIEWWPLQARGAEAGHIRGRMLLGDSVGLGKSGSAILWLCKQGRFPAVVVTLTSLPDQWAMEAIPQFTRGLTSHVVTKGQPYDMRLRKGKGRKPATPGPMPDIILISYSKLAGWAEALVDLGIRDIVFDEVQELRGGDDAARWNAAYHMSVNAERVFALSATPFYNYGDEFWNVAEIISPGELGTHEEFTTTWCKTNDKGKKVIDDPVAFGSYLRESGLMLRRTRAEADRELPGGEPLKIPQHVSADMRAIENVSDSLMALAKAIVRKDELYRGERMQASGMFDMKMRQACGIAKSAYIADFVKLLLESEEKILLYGWHREVYQVWQRMLVSFAPVMYTGSEGRAEKARAKESFIDGPARILMMSNRAGAGVDGLQKVCNIAVIGELDWSPGVLEQMIGRLAREGQDKRVLAYFAIANTVADNKMIDVLGIKRQQIEGVRDLKRNLIEELQTDGGHVRAMAEAYLASRGVGGK